MILWYLYKSLWKINTHAWYSIITSEFWDHFLLESCTQFVCTDTHGNIDLISQKCQLKQIFTISLNSVNCARNWVVCLLSSGFLWMAVLWLLGPDFWKRKLFKLVRLKSLTFFDWFFSPNCLSLLIHRWTACPDVAFPGISYSIFCLLVQILTHKNLTDCWLKEEEKSQAH